MKKASAERRARGNYGKINLRQYPEFVSGQSFNNDYMDATVRAKPTSEDRIFPLLASTEIGFGGRSFQEITDTTKHIGSHPAEMVQNPEVSDLGILKALENHLNLC